VERAAGGVVVRRGPGGPQILLIEQCDWRTGRATTRLPKGKPEPGEGPQATALREVEEETGIRAGISRELGTWRYAFFLPRRGHYVHKRVRFYLMHPRGGTPRPQPGETERVRWAPLADALGRLTFSTEREVVREARALLA
jgi:8-oxo-dGTP pyrophosphatase MutT (NUDIX family)